MVLRLRWRQPPTGGEELSRAARLAAGRRGADSHGAGGDEMVARLGNREWERVEESEPLGEIFFFDRSLQLVAMHMGSGLVRFFFF
jgi:hypothetical protein